MKVYQAQKEVIDTDGFIVVETKKGRFQLIEGMDTGCLYVTAVDENTIVVNPSGYNCIKVSQEHQ